MKRLMLITGMHRSGTSATARLLNLLGVDLGADLKNDQPQINAHGFWENRQALAIDEAVLADLQSVWYEHREWPDNWWRDAGLDRRRRQIQLMVQAHLSESDWVGIKDPRLCILLPLWLDALQSFNIEIAVVVVVRDPRDVARSLRKRDGFDLTYGVLIWLRYVLAAERYSRGCLRSVVDYSHVLTDPVTVARQVAQDLGFSWPLCPESIEKQLAVEINRRLCHYRSSADNRPATSRLATHAAGIYRHLQSDRSNGRDPLDSLSADYMAWPEFAHEALAQTNKQLVGLNIEIDRIGGMHSQALKVIDQRDEQLDRLERQLSALGASHANALATIQQRDREIEALTRTIDNQKQDLTDLTTIHSQLQNKLRQIQSHWSWGVRRRLLKYGRRNATC